MMKDGIPTRGLSHRQKIVTLANPVCGPFPSSQIQLS